MRIKSTLTEVIEHIELDANQALKASFNFILSKGDDKQLFHVALNGSEIGLREDLAENALGEIRSREDTLQALLDMGFNPVEAFMKIKIPANSGDFKLPHSDSVVFIESKTPSGTELQFSLFMNDNTLIIGEGEAADADIKVKIRSSFLPKLISGNFNLPMALISGKIKITNKTGLMQVLSKLGLNL